MGASDSNASSPSSPINYGNSLEDNLAQIDAINSPEKIAEIFVLDILPQIQATGKTDLPRAILLIWLSSAAFLRRLKGDKCDKVIFKEITIVEMRKLYPSSQSLSQAEQDPTSIAISCSTYAPLSLIIPGPDRDKLINMSLTILQPPPPPPPQ